MRSAFTLLALLQTLAVLRSVDAFFLLSTPSQPRGCFDASISNRYKHKVDERTAIHAKKTEENNDARYRARHAIVQNPLRSVCFSSLMIVSGAALGPFLDSFHSAFGVLQYDAPIAAPLWGNEEFPALITAWWVPELFGLAGFLIGWIYIVFDAVFADRMSEASRFPSAPNILIGISIFTFQYWLSGLLYQSGVDRSVILNTMLIFCASGFLVLDNTIVGLIASTATAVGGPLIEAGLLTLSRNGHFFHGTGYHYTDLGETGFFPLWIVPVYFLGGPANGNLARGYWNALGAALESNIVERKKVNERNDLPGCKVCNDTRRVSCPNCDGMGTYAAMGGSLIKCNCCRGRGLVICRSCFSHYDEDPNDLQAIRELMAKMPD